MKKKPIEYVVYKYGSEIARTMAVSSIQAINNVRYSRRGIIGMWQEDDAYAYKAVPSVVIECRKYCEECKKESVDFEQMRLPI
jgi:hypothetical protein